MKVTVESTDEFRNIQGSYCRLWRGTDSKGQKIALVVYQVILQPGADESEAKHDLRPVPMTGLEQTIVCRKEDIHPEPEKASPP